MCVYLKYLYVCSCNVVFACVFTLAIVHLCVAVHIHTCLPEFPGVCVCVCVCVRIPALLPDTAEASESHEVSSSLMGGP